MAWVARNSNNSTRTPSAYVRHDKDGNVIAGGLLGRNAYDRHNSANNHDTDNPTHTTKTDDFGNQYYDWNADYVHHKSDGSTDSVPLAKSTKPHIEGTLRVGSEITIFKGAFTGGVAPVTLATKLQARTAGSSDSWANLTSATASTTHTYTLTASEVGKELRAKTTATDDDGNTLANNGDKTSSVVAQVSVTTAISYTGFVKVGKELSVVGATATGGISPLQYLNQVTFDSGAPDFDVNTVNMGGPHNTAGFAQTYTIPNTPGSNITFRTRIRDNDGLGDYDEEFSSTSQATIADVMTSTGDNGTMTGVFKAGETVAGDTLPTFNGGIAPFTYAVKFQVSADGSSGWTDFGGGFTDVGATLAANEATSTLTASEATKYIRMQTQVTDATGDTLIRGGVTNGPIAAALEGSGNSTLSGTLQDTQTLTVDGEATFSGGSSPVNKEFQWQISDTGSGGFTGWGSGWATYATTVIGETKVIATADVGKYVRLQQRATDDAGAVTTRAGTVYGPLLA